MSDRPEHGATRQDPSGIEEPHDVLAAEEFAMPTPEERYPRDPTGIEEPHDVLAAEEFAMPSPSERASSGRRGPSGRRLAVALLPAAALAIWLSRRR